jgi:hypothetical protein
MSDEIQKTALRLPRGLHEAIHKAAKESGRTMNAEIVYRLQQSFDVSPAPSVHEVEFKVSDQRIPQSSDDKKLKGLLARMMEILEMAEQDEAREIIEENEAYESRAELDDLESKKPESAKELTERMKKAF